jgi:hypothetical protein
LLASKREDETAVAAPIGRDVRDGLETMRDSVVDLFFVLVL